MNQCPKIELSQNHKTGIPGIDAQHKELLIMLDAFQNLLKEEDTSTDSVEATIQAILVHLRAHFSTEENLMEMVSFPQVKEHKKLHRNFITLILETIKDTASIEYLKISDFFNAFRHDVLTHIGVHDRDYVLYVDNLMAARKQFGITTLKARAIVG